MNATEAVFILLGLYTIVYGLSTMFNTLLIYIAVGIVVLAWGILSAVT